MKEMKIKGKIQNAKSILGSPQSWAPEAMK
jgi:hypothetical protein